MTGESCKDLTYLSRSTTLKLLNRLKRKVFRGGNIRTLVDIVVRVEIEAQGDQAIENTLEIQH